VVLFSEPGASRPRAELLRKKFNELEKQLKRKAFEAWRKAWEGRWALEVPASNQDDSDEEKPEQIERTYSARSETTSCTDTLDAVSLGGELPSIGDIGFQGTVSTWQPCPEIVWAPRTEEITRTSFPVCRIQLPGGSKVDFHLAGDQEVVGDYSSSTPQYRVLCAKSRFDEPGYTWHRRVDFSGNKKEAAERIQHDSTSIAQLISSSSWSGDVVVACSTARDRSPLLLAMVVAAVAGNASPREVYNELTTRHKQIRQENMTELARLCFGEIITCRRDFGVDADVIGDIAARPGPGAYVLPQLRTAAEPHATQITRAGAACTTRATAGVYIPPHRR